MEATRSRPRNRNVRVLLISTLAVLTTIALTLNSYLVNRLADGKQIDWGLLQLRLFFNSGVSFSFGKNLPTWVVLTVTGVLTTGLAYAAWRHTPIARWPVRWGMTAAIAGAVTNVIDRAFGGSVTDYFHTGWFATFNLADVYITVGIAVTLISLTFQTRTDEQPVSESKKEMA